MKLIITKNQWKNFVKSCKFDSWKNLMKFRREFIISKPIDISKITELNWKYRPFL